MPVQESYLVRKQLPIVRQAGDTGSVKMVVPAFIETTAMFGFFQVRDEDGEIVFTKDGGVALTEVEIDDHNLYVHLAGTESALKEGVYVWECEIYNSGRTIVSTIGKGPYTIIKENATPST